MESRTEKLLRLWKARQTAEGHDVSGVKTLEEAEHFFDNCEKQDASVPSSDTACAVPPSPQGEGLEAPVIPDEEEIEDEQCDIDPVDEPV